MDVMARERFGKARIARLATVGPDGPQLVPLVFAMLDDLVVSAVDHKPKTTRNLQRLRNIETDPRVCLLVDHYDVDWAALWWVRLDGLAAVHDGNSPLGVRAIDALVAKYPQYRITRPGGPVVVVTPERWTSWSAAPPPSR